MGNRGIFFVLFTSSPPTLYASEVKMQLCYFVLPQYPLLPDNFKLPAWSCRIGLILTQFAIFPNWNAKCKMFDWDENFPESLSNSRLSFYLNCFPLSLPPSLSPSLSLSLPPSLSPSFLRGRGGDEGGVTEKGGIMSVKQCCGSGSGSGRIRSFGVLRIRIRENTGSRSFIHKKTPVIQIFSVSKIV